MTDNLRFKVDEILESMQNEYLSIAAKLDDIIVLLGGVPPTSSATLDSVVEAIQGTNQLLVNVVTNTTAIDQRLARLEAGLTLPIGSGVPNVQSNLDSVVLYLSNIITLINGMPLDDQLVELQTMVSYLANIRSSVGLLPSAEATPIRDLLVDISECVCNEGIPPDGEPNEACTASNGMVNHVYYIGSGVGIVVNVAVWDSAPVGTTFTNDYEIVETNTELTPDDGWEGWSVYVQSSAQYWMIAPGDGPFKPTNQWIALGTDSAPIAPCVMVPHTITVTLCPPDGGGEIGWPNDCVTLNGDVVTTVDFTGDNSTHQQLSVDLSPLGYGSSSTVVIPGGTLTFSPATVVALCDAVGFTFRLVSGPFAHVAWLKTDGNVNDHTFTVIDHSYTIPDNTVTLLIDNWTGSSANLSEPFVMEICPPTEG